MRLTLKKERQKRSNKDLLVAHDHSVIFNRHKARSHMHLFASIFDIEEIYS